jgi:hypothetical protein
MREVLKAMIEEARRNLTRLARRVEREGAHGKAGAVVAEELARANKLLACCLNHPLASIDADECPPV